MLWRGACLFVAVTATWAPSAAGQSFGNAMTVGDGEIFVGEPVQEMRSGVVYVFRQDTSGAWIQAQRLEPAAAQPANRFGIRTALQDDVLLVSATRDDAGSGAVYVYRRNGGTWSESGRLVTDDRSPADSLGSGLAIDGDWIMVGTVAQNGGRGAVYAFRRSGDSWVQHSKLTVPGLLPVERFGSKIVIDGAWALVSAPGRAEGAGAVYVFQYDPGADQWRSRGTLQAPELDAQTGLGSDIALAGEVALVSAPGLLGGIGMVFSYELLDGDWRMADLVSPFVADQGGQFGQSLSFDGRTAWIGAPGAGGTGRSYAFVRDADSGEWMEARRLAVDETGRAAFGSTVAANGDWAVASALGVDYSAGAAYVFQRTDSGWSPRGRVAGDVLGMESITGDEVACSDDGEAAAFDCQSVDLLSFLPVSAMGAGRGVRTNDVWGWTDPETGHEIVLVGMTDQTAFVDVTNPGDPVYLGRLPMSDGANGSSWRDMKVYRDHMYVVSDGAGPHGMQVFDLTRLRGVDPSDPQTFTPDARYDQINSSHNIVINEETGFAYAVGAGGGGETCGGGLHMIDIRTPKSPTFAGCFQDTSTGRQRTGYSHDAQCVLYKGPDSDYAGREICFGSNETALSIADVTDKADPVAVAMASYPNVGYSHQGWVSQDHAYFFMNDELDELGGGVPSTRTLVWDISDLDDPVLVKEHFSENHASDHNLYVLGSTMYQSNYVSGLRVLDVSDPVNPVQVGFFDTVPYGEDGPGFNGSWSNYPFFRSGIVVVTSGREGLFVVRYRPRAVS